MHFNLVPPISSSQFKRSPTRPSPFTHSFFSSVGREYASRTSSERRITHCPCRIASYYYTIIIPIIVIPSNIVTPRTCPLHSHFIRPPPSSFFPPNGNHREKPSFSLARSHSRNVIQRAAMKRGEATPSRTSILHRLSTGFILTGSREQLTRLLSPAILAVFQYVHPFRPSHPDWFKKIFVFCIRFASFVSPRCRFNLSTFPGRDEEAAFIFLFFYI